MSKQVSAAELADVVKRLLTDVEGTGELDGHETFQSFMTAIAQVVCDHCGGEIHNPADNFENVWYVGIHGNDSLPDAFGGIWREIDKAGELWPEGAAQQLQSVFADEHPDLPLADWQYQVSNGDTKLSYWEWVAQELPHREDNEDTVAAIERERSRNRNIFVELVNAKSLSVYGSDGEDLIVRGDLIARTVLETYPVSMILTPERFLVDDEFGECLIRLSSSFDFAAWHGKTLGECLAAFVSSHDEGESNALQYRSTTINKDGVAAVNVTLNMLREAQPLGETGWLLPDGVELYLHQSKAAKAVA